MAEPTEPSLTALADAAFRQAFVKVVRLAQQTGTPVLVWGPDGIRALSPAEAVKEANLPPETLDVPYHGEPRGR